tara:strand:- start:732 stop:1112 length:381 start_codon:yes stop_codon:yes gene_type:complete
MKKENGASNFFSNFNDRIDQSAERTKEMIEPKQESMVNQGEFQGFGNKTLPNKFQGFGNNQVQSINESEVQPLMNNTTGVTQQNINDFPISNGTGSARPNFDQTTTMNVEKVNEGAAMSNVLFKKK